MGAEQSTPAVAASERAERDVYPSALVICGPSGVGKGTLIRKLLADPPADRFGFSCSHTTRSPRDGEQEGIHYFFVDKATFEADVKAGKFLEYAVVHNNYYGTSITAVASVAESGKCCILDIDTQGARQVRNAGLRAIFVFVAPPNAEELEKRLRGRGTEAEEQIQRRLQAAYAEMDAAKEKGLFDYVIVNDDLDVTAAELRRVAMRALAGEVGPDPNMTQPINGTTTEHHLPSQEHHSSGTVSTVGPTDSVSQSVEMQAPTEATAEADEEQEVAGVALAATDSQTDDTSVKPMYHGTYEQHRDKIVIVTGASSPAGAALCRALALAGLRVVALAKTREGLQTLQKELILEAGISAANFLPIVCDTTKEAEVVAVPRIVAKRWPDAGIDILIHNEDVSSVAANLLEGSADQWREAMLETMLSLCLCAREVVQNMQSRKNYGYIINIVSDYPVSASEPATFSERLLTCCKAAVQTLTAAVFQDVKSQQLPVPVCNVVYSQHTISTTAHVGDRTVQFSKASQDLQADILEAVAWCLIN